MSYQNEVIQANLQAESVIVISKTIYSIACILAGTLVCYLGYKLFVARIFNEAGELTAKYKKYEFILKRSAPGTFFIIFGSLIIIWAIYHAPNFKRKNYFGPPQNGQVVNKNDTSKKAHLQDTPPG